MRKNAWGWINILGPVFLGITLVLAVAIPFYIMNRKFLKMSPAEMANYEQELCKEKQAKPIVGHFDDGDAVCDQSHSGDERIGRYGDLWRCVKINDLRCPYWYWVRVGGNQL